MTKSRRKHLTRDPTAKIPPLEQIDQGLPILRLLDRLGWLVNDQIESLLFRGSLTRDGRPRTPAGAEYACNLSLRQLFDAGLLDRVPLFLIPPFVPTHREGWVHVPTGRAVALLEAAGEEALWRAGHKPAAYQARFEHSLLVSWFGYVAMLACKEHPWQLWNYLADRHLAAAKVAGAHFATIPDGQFVISNLATGHDFPHFYEIDRGFTTGLGEGRRDDWVQKIARYGAYLGPGGDWSADYGALPKPVVLIVTVSLKRAGTILEAIAAAEGGGAYWVATFDEVAERGLWGRIWRVVGERESRTLMHRCCS